MGIYPKKALILSKGWEKDAERKLHLRWNLRGNGSFPGGQVEKTSSVKEEPWSDTEALEVNGKFRSRQRVWYG